MRFTPYLLSALVGWAALPSCQVPPTGVPPAGDADPVSLECANGFVAAGERCEPILPPAGTCPPRSRARLGSDTCVPVGPGPCPTGFVTDPSGWSCEPTLPADDCLPGTAALLGEETCQPVGWTVCDAGFVPSESGWGCRAQFAADACATGTRAALGSDACIPLGDCAQPFGPAEVDLWVDAAFSDGELDATHFRTIGEAVAAAASGAVVAIESGTYAEALELDQGITLIGRCAAEVVLDGTGIDDEGLRISAPDVVIRDLTVRGHRRGIVAGAGASVEISGLLVDRARGIGVGVTDEGTQLSLIRSVISGTVQDENLSRGISVQRGAFASITAVEITGSPSPNLMVSGEGSHLVAAEVISHHGGRGCLVIDGARLELTTSAVWHQAGVGIEVRDPGSVALLTAVDVRHTIVGDEARAPGLDISAGAEVTGERLTIDASTAVGIALADPGSRAALIDVVVTGTLPDAEAMAIGIAVSNDAELELAGSALRDHPSAAIGLTNASAALSRCWIGPGSAYGVVAGGASNVTIDASHLALPAGLSLDVIGAGSTARIEDSVIHGGALAAIDAGQIAIERSVVQEITDIALLADGANSFILVRECVVRRVWRPDPENVAGGVVTAAGATARLEDSSLLGIEGDGIYVEAGAVEVQDCLIGSLPAEPAAADSRAVMALGEINLQGSALLNLASPGLVASSQAIVTESLVRSSRTAGIFAAESAQLTAAGCTVEETAANEEDAYGFGILVGNEAQITETLVRGNTYAGIAIDGSLAAVQPRVTVERCVIEETSPAGDGYGHGILTGTSSLHLLDSVVRGNRNVGLVFSWAGGLVSGSRVEANAVGVHCQDGTEMIEVEAPPGELEPKVVVFTRDTAFVGNDSRIGVGVLPIPALLPP